MNAHMLQWVKQKYDYSVDDINAESLYTATAQAFRRFDADGNGKLSEEEYPYLDRQASPDQHKPKTMPKQEL